MRVQVLTARRRVGEAAAQGLRGQGGRAARLARQRQNPDAEICLPFTLS